MIPFTIEGYAMTREEIRQLALDAKDRLGLSWPKVGEAIGRSPVYAAMLTYGYGAATPEEADGLDRKSVG